jgi:hypothetical protein
MNPFTDFPLELTFLIFDHLPLHTWHALKATCHHTAWLIEQYIPKYCDLFNFSERATLGTLTLFLQLWFSQDTLQTSTIAGLHNLFFKHTLKQTIDNEHIKSVTLACMSAAKAPTLLRHNPHLLPALFRELKVCPLDIHNHNLLTASSKLGGLPALQHIMSILDLKVVDLHWAEEVMISAALADQPDVVFFFVHRLSQSNVSLPVDFKHRLVCSAVKSGNCTLVTQLFDRLQVNIPHYDSCTCRQVHDVCTHRMATEWPLKTLLCAAIESKSLDMLHHMFSLFELESYEAAAIDFLRCAICTNSLEVVQFVVTKTKKRLKKILPKNTQSNHFCFSSSMDVVTYLKQNLKHFPFRHGDAYHNLFTACLFGRLDTVREILFRRNDTIVDCMCGLDAAADVGNLEIVRYLVINRGLKPRDFENSQALLFAAVHEHMPVLRYLLTILDLNTAKANVQKFRVFFAVVISLKIEVARFLIEKLSLCADDLPDPRNIMLKLLAGKGCLGLLKLLFERVKMTIPQADAALLPQMAATGGHLETTQYLIETMGCPASFSLLIAALYSGNMRLVQYVESKPINHEAWKPNIFPQHKITNSQEHLTTIRHAVDLFKLTPDDARAHNHRALRTAVQWGELLLLKYLVESMGFGIDDLVSNDHEAMKTALTHNYMHIVKYLTKVCGNTVYSQKSISDLKRVAIEANKNARNRFTSTCCDIRNIDAHWGVCPRITLEGEMQMWVSFGREYLHAMQSMTEHYCERAGLPNSISVGMHGCAYVAVHDCPRIRHLRQWIMTTMEPAPLHKIKKWPTDEQFFANFRNINAIHRLLLP